MCLLIAGACSVVNLEDLLVESLVGAYRGRIECVCIRRGKYAYVFMSIYISVFVFY